MLHSSLKESFRVNEKKLLMDFWLLMSLLIFVAKSTFSHTHDLMLGVLGTPEWKKNTRMHLSKPEVIPYAMEDMDSGSSNLLVDEDEQFGAVKYELALNLVKKKHKEKCPHSGVRTSIKWFPVTANKDFSNMLATTSVKTVKNKVYIYGQSQMRNSNLSDLCEFMKGLSQLQNVPIIFWACTEKSEYIVKETPMPTFLSLLPDVELISKSVVSVLRYYNWRQIVWISTTTPGYLFQICDHLEKTLVVSDYFSLQASWRLRPEATIENFRFHDNMTKNQFWKKAFLSDASVTIMCLPHEIDGSLNKPSNVVKDLLEAAYAIDENRMKNMATLLLDGWGLYAGQHRDSTLQHKNYEAKNHSSDHHDTKINGEILQKVSPLEKNASEKANIPAIFEDDPVNANKPNAPKVMHDVYENVLVISPLLDQSFPKSYSDFVAKHKGAMATSHLAYILDAVYLALLTGSRAIDHNSTISNNNASAFMEVIAKDDVQGFTGLLNFDSRSYARNMNFSLWDIVRIGDVREVRLVKFIDTTEGSNYLKIRPVRDVTWSSSSQPASDKCYHESIHDCQLAEFSQLEYVLIGIILVLLSSISCIAYCRKRQESHALFRGPNKLFLTESDVVFEEDLTREKDQENAAKVDKGSEAKKGNWVALRMEQTHTIALLKGEHTYLKKLCAQSVDMKRFNKKILKELQFLHHENLCQFHGLLTTKSYHFLLMEYGVRGSLKDVISSWSSTLNVSMKMSLVQDLVRGMKFIHLSSIHCHGRLKSSNCVIDGRFALKITDFGVNKFQAISNKESCLDCTAKDFLWTAPELLKDANLRSRGTQKADSYSFAIICQEILLCMEPYAMLEYSPEEVVEKLKSPVPQTRPVISSNELGLEFNQIMKQCWQEQPELRMTFSAINLELKNLNDGHDGNVVECMQKMLDNSSEKLQQLVNERTMQLQEEKKKTETLLMKMLPPSIAKLLMANKKISPELFEKSTIYFSDICGFTTIAHASTPMQVIDFLNDLYTCFDEIIDKYEVYKVETIGDAYMVSSGIPKVIGDRHAEEAAMVALDILSATTTFRVGHLPEIKLNIRIGMHSGSAVAGVVGFTAPRYCLFGDTINTASRLETTGKPSCIHISCETQKCLAQSDKEFILKERGSIELKGRGSMITYWLLGLKGYTKPLPDPGSLPSKDKLKPPSTSAKNVSSNNSKPCTKSSSRKCYDEVVTTPPMRSGSSFLVSTPLALLPPCEPTPSSHHLPSSTNPHTSKNASKTKKRFFHNAAVAPEENINSIT